MYVETVEVDPFLVLPEDRTKRLSQKLFAINGTRFLSGLMTDDWYLDTTATFLSQRSRTMEVLSPPVPRT